MRKFKVDLWNFFLPVAKNKIHFEATKPLLRISYVCWQRRN